MKRQLDRYAGRHYTTKSGMIRKLIGDKLAEFIQREMEEDSKR